MNGVCDVPHCQRPTAYIWAVRKTPLEVCEHHWEKHCNEKDQFKLHDVIEGKPLRELRGTLLEVMK